MLALFAASTSLLVQPSMPSTSLAAPRASPVTMAGGNIPAKKVWVTFAESRDCKPGTVISGFKYGQEVAIATTKKGGLFALSNKLPPTGQPATLGTLVDDVIVDPVSSTAFSLKTGKIQGTWCPSPIAKLIFSRLVAPQDVPVFPVRKSGNNVQVLIDVNAKARFESNYWRGVLDAQGKVDGGYY